MKAIILEDEILAQNRLQRQLIELDMSIEVTHCFESVKDLAEHLVANPHPFLLFLDINVEDGSSFELFDILEVKSHIIFTTAYSEYAIEAFQKNATHYLLKPIKLHDLKDAISRASAKSIQPIANINNDDLYYNRFLIKFASKLFKIPTSEIAYIYSKNKITYFIKKDGQRIASDHKLQFLEEKLDPQKFFRINRQFIVNESAIDIMRVTSRSRIEVKLNPNFESKIIISTERTPLFKQWLNSNES